MISDAEPLYPSEADDVIKNNLTQFLSLDSNLIIQIIYID